MIILQPNCSLSRDIVARDEAALTQKIKDKEAIVIIPGEYDIVSMDDACEVIEIEKRYDDGTIRTMELSKEELKELKSKDSIADMAEWGKLIVEGFRRGLHG